MKIGGTIRDLRKQQGHKQGEFAKLIDISPTALSQIERDVSVPKESTLNKICTQLNITSQVLYLLSVKVDDIPSANKDKYLSMFPQVRNLMIQIFSEEDGLPVT